MKIFRIMNIICKYNILPTKTGTEPPMKVLSIKNARHSWRVIPLDIPPLQSQKLSLSQIPKKRSYT